jgi:hypothetical protein
MTGGLFAHLIRTSCAAQPLCFQFSTLLTLFTPTYAVTTFCNRLFVTISPKPLRSKRIKRNKYNTKDLACALTAQKVRNKGVLIWHRYARSVDALARAVEPMTCDAKWKVSHCLVLVSDRGDRPVGFLARKAETTAC